MVVPYYSVNILTRIVILALHVAIVGSNGAATLVKDLNPHRLMRTGICPMVRHARVGIYPPLKIPIPINPFQRATTTTHNNDDAARYYIKRRRMIGLIPVNNISASFR